LLIKNSGTRMAEFSDASEFRTYGNVIFNEDGADNDFRVESSTDAYALFVQGSDGSVGLGTGSPSEILHLHERDASAKIRIQKFEVDGHQVPDQVIGAVEFWSNDDNWTPSGGSAGDGGLRASVQAIIEGTSADTGLQFFTGASGADAVEVMRINSYKRVGIGEPSPLRRLHIGGASGSDSTLLLHMDADTVGGECGIEFKADSTNDDRRIKAAIKYKRDDPGTRGTGNLHFCVHGGNDDVNVSTTHSRMMLNTDGLHFNGDTAAANALDDYEEGNGNSSAIAVKLGSTALTVSGVGYKYTKIGNIVNFQFEFRITDLNGASSGAFTVGLPFAAVSGGYSAGALRIYNGAVDGNEFIGIDSNASILYLARNRDSNSTTDITATDSAYYFGQITYTTS